MEDAARIEVDAERRRIDAIDEELVRLLARRGRAAATIGAIKRRIGAPVRDTDREETVRTHVRSLVAGTGLDPAALERIFDAIMALCRDLEEHDARRRAPREGTSS